VFRATIPRATPRHPAEREG